MTKHEANVGLQRGFFRGGRRANVELVIGRVHVSSCVVVVKCYSSIGDGFLTKVKGVRPCLIGFTYYLTG